MADVFLALGNLLLRSGKLSIEIMGTSTVSVISGIVIFFVTAVYALRRGTPLKHQWAGAIGVALVASVVVWLLVFGWCIVATIYQNHKGLSAKNRELGEKIKQYESPRINLPIMGIVTSVNDIEKTTRFQLVVYASNLGRPTIAHGWKATLQTKTYSVVGLWLPGEMPIPGTKVFRPLDEQLSESALGLAERPGLLYFLLHRAIDVKVLADSDTKIILSAFDDLGREWKTETYTKPLSDEKTVHLKKSKP